MFPDNLYDFIDSLNDSSVDAVVFGQEIDSYLSQTNSSMMNNTCGSSSITSWFGSPMVDDHTKHCVPHDFSFSGVDSRSENPPQENLILGNNIENPVQGYEVGGYEEAPIRPKRRNRTRPPSQTHAHILAERRRREQLSQLFIALSALIPGLKKMDKSSVLEDAIKYMKQLQERVKKLEEMAEKGSMESVIIVKKFQIVVGDKEDEEKDENNETEERTLPEIEARVSDNHMLLRIQCERHKGILSNLLSKIESLGVIVVNTNATPFGDVALDITIVAELEKEFNLTTNQVIAMVREALQ